MICIVQIDMTGRVRWFVQFRLIWLGEIDGLCILGRKGQEGQKFCVVYVDRAGSDRFLCGLDPKKVQMVCLVQVDNDGRASWCVQFRLIGLEGLDCLRSQVDIARRDRLFVQFRLRQLYRQTVCVVQVLMTEKDRWFVYFRQKEWGKIKMCYFV